MPDDVSLDMRVHEHLTGWNPKTAGEPFGQPPEHIPDYSSNMEATKEVLAWIRRRGWSITTEPPNSAGRITATVSDGKVKREADGATEEEAICRVALRIPRP